MVFDTETCSLQKPFCYDVGYRILNSENGEVVVDKHFIIEQVWHNLELFSSAYYAEKRPDYVNLMRTRKATMTKWGYAMSEMIRDIKKYEVTDAYAYNSNFDDGVFTFNCDWYKTRNPFDNVAIHDIWGYASQFITNRPEYKEFCEKYSLFTESGNYSASAENVYRFITNNEQFNEAHMGLYDSQIEGDILNWCFTHGAEMATDYPVTKYLPRKIAHPYEIIINGKTIYHGEYMKKYIRDDKYKFTE